jgi:prepilin-type N-terminal cleavage/methylation domain-containing protein
MMKMTSAQLRKASHSGFTLVEILIVVVILGILAAIVIPSMSNASSSARANTLKDDLRFMREQNATYRILHKDTSPGFDVNTSNASEATYVGQMTLFTDDLGNTSANQTATFKNGPYLSQIPQNPVNGKSNILVVQNGAPLPAAASDSYGWIYQPGSQTFLSDATGTDEKGANYFSY